MNNQVFRFCTCGNQSGTFQQLGANDEYIVDHHECGGMVIRPRRQHKETLLEKINGQQASYIEILEKKIRFLEGELNPSGHGRN
ncbi:hypothetical protein J27TS7_57820 [Paenibacillus dendritiformis]|uniref:hypothetical protein n=1 Tax=Paenibacillus dendritiformis TaxID=130049 RepID=UPI001B0035B1|nr:hypothetical protein [Paenibacillus dendritiformis]GIO76268.1 hypothetical protein J27TS7_57820 [Paenibacillus dendritiformis]